MGIRIFVACRIMKSAILVVASPSSNRSIQLTVHYSC